MSCHRLARRNRARCPTLLVAMTSWSIGKSDVNRVAINTTSQSSSAGSAVGNPRCRASAQSDAALSNAASEIGVQSDNHSPFSGKSLRPEVRFAFNARLSCSHSALRCSSSAGSFVWSSAAHRANSLRNPSDRPAVGRCCSMICAAHCRGSTPRRSASRRSAVARPSGRLIVRSIVRIPVELQSYCRGSDHSTPLNELI